MLNISLSAQKLGAQKNDRGNGTEPGIQFGVYAPNAQNVEVVFGLLWKKDDPHKTPVNQVNPVAFEELAGGYIADDGTGIDQTLPVVALYRDNDGCWLSDPDDPYLRRFADWVHVPYMFRIRKSDGSIAYRTDLYSRCQIGAGCYDPMGEPYEGLVIALEGSKSCSIIVDPDTVTNLSPETVDQKGFFPEKCFISQENFWSNEFSPNKPLPKRLEDLVIYQLHIPALGFGRPDLGNVADAVKLLDYLVDLGINAVELLPISEYGGHPETWGYSTTHHFAIESSSGGRDRMKYFIREAHRRGFVVFFDVVYNHYAHDAERAEWMYDTNDDAQNVYYWYHGQRSDHEQAHDGYVDNESTAFAPRYDNPFIQNLFIASAVALVKEFHVDGFRVDQTTSIHAYNKLHAYNRLGINSVWPGETNRPNISGADFLRNWVANVQAANPNVFLMAEDHSTWSAVTEPVAQNGLGFDAVWHADFHHHLLGATKGNDYAKLIATAGYGNDASPLAMSHFAGALWATSGKKIAYHISHDEAGNSDRFNADPDKRTHRTIMLAVRNNLNAASRPHAEARCRVAFGVTLFSAATPLFLFGEEVAFQRDFLYDDVKLRREDIYRLKKTTGQKMFDFYHDAIQLRHHEKALRSKNIEILHVHNDNRILAFRRWEGKEEIIVVVSLNNQPFDHGYNIFHHSSIAQGSWNVLINSGDPKYGGNNRTNATMFSQNGMLSLPVVPANGIVVLKKT
ncbi:MAG: alpha-amylase family glycosyl hydrolase [Planctomycetaceae bacterium]|nr:alpha-amylase family glycosyl hydrolase [Planctomycetaceae bacterium]